METNNSSKIKLLKLWEILERDSDEECHLTTNEILEKLKYNGIECDRRTFYKDIKILNSFGYEVICNRGQHSNEYYVVDRSFDIPELHILLDAVRAASFITTKKTLELSDKIASLAGSYRAELIKRNVIQFNTVKNDNECIFYNISNIIDAIFAEKKVSFRYFDYDERKKRIYRKDGEEYIVNPIGTVFSNDKYYLLCYDDNHDDVASYRVDRMAELSVSADMINIKRFPKGFEPSRHHKQVFSMFTGETVKVTIRIDKKLIDAVIDKFGKDIVFINHGDKVEFICDIQISPTFFGWCCSFGDRLKLMSPINIVNRLKEYIVELQKQYIE